MSSFLFTVFSFVLALSILIAVHEFGHFWVARRLGVRVLRFSIGFGRPLWRYQASEKDTEYVLAALPLGGYVKMLDEREGEVEPAEQHRAFNRQTLSVRSAIVSAGPIFNFLFAILAYWLIFSLGDDGTRPLIGEVIEGTAAAEAGFAPRDSIEAIGGHETPTWEMAGFQLVDQSGGSDAVAVTVTTAEGYQRVRYLRTDEVAENVHKGRVFEALGLRPYRPLLAAVIGGLVDDGAAARAGLKEGDRIVGADGNAISGWEEWVELVRSRPDQRFAIEVDRDGVRMDLSIRPEAVNDSGQRIGRIGAYVEIPDDYYDEIRVTVQYPPMQALVRGFEKTVEMSVMMVRMLWRMITGQLSTENISGPISIAQYAGQSADFGFIPFIKFLAIVSISLGVLNLLPVPILDGGHLLFYAIEAIKGSEVSEQAQQVGLKIGIVLLVMLMSLAFYNDLTRIFQ